MTSTHRAERSDRPAQHAAPDQPGQPSALMLNLVPLLYLLHTLIAVAVVWGLNLTPDQQGAIDTIAASTVAIVAAFSAKPWYLAGAGSAAIAILTAFGAFGLHISADKIGTGVALASALFAYLSHQSVIPTPAANLGTTAHELMLARAKKTTSPPV